MFAKTVESFTCYAIVLPNRAGLSFEKETSQIKNHKHYMIM